MAVYMISYDLNTPGKDYSKLIPGIKQLGDNYPLLKSQFLVSSKRTAPDLRDYVQKLIDPNDDLFVVEITKNYAAYISNAEKLQAWIESHS